MNDRARLKTDPMQVWQYKLPQWVINCTECHDDGLYLVRASGKQRIELGDWLLRDLDGTPLWSTDANFRRQYEVLR